jgi:thiosulfate reductase cytochrome b subunit
VADRNERGGKSAMSSTGPEKPPDETQDRPEGAPAAAAAGAEHPGDVAASGGSAGASASAATAVTGEPAAIPAGVGAAHSAGATDAERSAAAAAPERPAATVAARPVAPALAEVPVAAAPAPGKRPLVHRHHWLVRVTHWANAVLLAGMIASGLQIYNAFGHFGKRGGPFYPNPFDGKPFPPWSRLGGWLAGGLNWHFALAWPFVITGAAYLLYLVFSGEWRSLLFRPSDVPRAMAMQLYYLRLRREHPPQGKHNALQKGAYTFILLLGVISVLSGFAIYKPAQLSWLTALFGGYELARYWHFWAVFLFLAFTLVHVTLVLVVDPASLRAMITGWYRGRFPSHD